MGTRSLRGHLQLVGTGPLGSKEILGGSGRGLVFLWIPELTRAAMMLDESHSGYTTSHKVKMSSPPAVQEFLGNHGVSGTLSWAGSSESFTRGSLVLCLSHRGRCCSQATSARRLRGHYKHLGSPQAVPSWASSSHPRTTEKPDSSQLLAAFSVIQALSPGQFFLQAFW